MPFSKKQAPQAARPKGACYDSRRETESSHIVAGKAPNRASNLRLAADDFKTGYHLEVGDLKSDRWKVETARRHHGDLPTLDPVRDADNRKASRAHGPCKRAEISQSEHIGRDGVSGYPEPTYLEPNGNGACNQVLEGLTW